jgi:hypothetical protein
MLYLFVLLLSWCEIQQFIIYPIMQLLGRDHQLLSQKNLFILWVLFEV